MIEKKENKPQNYEDLTEAQKIKNELNAIHDKLKEDKITIENAQAELNKINESLQKKDIEQSYKELIAEAFDRLTNNLKDNENIFKQEIEEIADLVHQATNLVQSTNKQLSRLKQAMWPQIRPPKVQAWINESSLALDSTIHDASKDNNPIASRIGNVMKRLNS